MHSLVASLLNRPRITQHTREWYTSRQTRLTASDISAIVGRNPYSSRSDVMRHKLNPSSGVSGSSDVACRHGLKYENLAGHAYSLVTGNTLIDEDIGLVCHPLYPADFGASPDRVVSSAPILVEIKCPYRRNIERGVIPTYYIDQLEFQMAVTGFDTVHFIQFKPVSVFNRGIIDIVAYKSDPNWWTTNYPVLRSFVDELHTKQSRPVARCLTVYSDGSFRDSTPKPTYTNPEVPAECIDLNAFNIDDYDVSVKL